VVGRQGILAGLVTISAGAATYEPYAAAIVGAAGGVVYCLVLLSHIPLGYVEYCCRMRASTYGTRQ
jgi:ammonia channel protein AmtB